MPKEIENKLLLSGLPEGLSKPAGVQIAQGYLSVKDPEVRVRSMGEKFYITSKGGEGFIRSEEEEEVTENIFQILWPATAGARVEKTRYTLASDGFVWEVDEYHGHLTGLFTAEVELTSEEAKPIVPATIAEVLITDVTEDGRYKNKALAVASGPPTASR